jgi:hypothetical protein
MLARTFRAHGFATDLFDGTDTFTCRMYERAGEVWNGFLKNAHEGLGSRRLIGLSTLFLLGGQVLPFCLLAVASNYLTVALAGLGAVAALMPRLVGVIRFRQSFLGAMLHPFGVCLLLAIQWSALIGSLVHRRVEWKNRSYLPLSVR